MICLDHAVHTGVRVAAKTATSDAKVIDLGTEFGLDVSKSGQTNLYVYDGEVELHPNKRASQNLITNQGVTWNDKEITAIPIDDSIISFDR